MSFANLKRNRDQISKLISAADAAGAGGGGKKNYGDDRVWKPTVDKAGNGYAVLRFLPATEGSELPWVRYWDHGFKGPTGQWYIEKSLTSIGQQDPVSEHNSELWNSGIDSNKEIVRKQKRRLHYVVNAMVVSDPANPANEGKIVLYQFGKKIFDKIMDVMQPQFADEDPVNPYDFWEGADFKIKIRQVEGWVNYDKSEFAAPSALFDSDEERLEKVYNQLYSLSDFIDPKNYKTYAELSAKLNKVLGVSAGIEAAAPVYEEVVAPQPAQVETETPDIEAVASSSDTDADDTMSYFAKLAKDG